MVTHVIVALAGLQRSVYDLMDNPTFTTIDFPSGLRLYTTHPIPWRCLNQLTSEELEFLQHYLLQVASESEVLDPWGPWDVVWESIEDVNDIIADRMDMVTGRMVRPGLMQGVMMGMPAMMPGTMAGMGVMGAYAVPGMVNMAGMPVMNPMLGMAGMPNMMNPMGNNQADEGNNNGTGNTRNSGRQNRNRGDDNDVNAAGADARTAIGDLDFDINEIQPRSAQDRARDMSSATRAGRSDRSDRNGNRNNNSGTNTTNDLADRVSEWSLNVLADGNVGTGSERGESSRTGAAGASGSVNTGRRPPRFDKTGKKVSE